MKKKLLAGAIMLSLALPAAAQAQRWQRGSDNGQAQGGGDRGGRGDGGGRWNRGDSGGNAPQAQPQRQVPAEAQGRFGGGLDWSSGGDRGNRGGDRGGDRGGNWQRPTPTPAPSVQVQRDNDGRRWDGNRDNGRDNGRDGRNWNRDGNRDRRDWNNNNVVVANPFARDRDRNWRDNDPNWRDDGPRFSDRNRWTDQRRWDSGWRNDRRYDWRSYRSYNAGRYRMPRYYAPRGWGYGYQRFGIGFTLSSLLFSSSYWIDDPYYYRLPPAYGTLRWVRYYDDALLVDIRDGYVVDVIHDFFD